MRTVLAVGLALVSGLAFGQATATVTSKAPTAAEIMGKAQAEAGQSGKNVWVIFHASWCGWCKELDKFMAVEANKKIIDKYYVVVHVTVMESADKKALENEGGAELMASLKGEGQGIPFFAFVDKNGKALVNSRRPTDTNKDGANVGHPVAPEEIAWFMEMLKKSAPKMTAQERSTLETWLKSQKIG